LAILAPMRGTGLCDTDIKKKTPDCAETQRRAKAAVRRPHPGIQRRDGGIFVTADFRTGANEAQPKNLLGATSKKRPCGYIPKRPFSGAPLGNGAVHSGPMPKKKNVLAIDGYLGAAPSVCAASRLAPALLRGQKRATPKGLDWRLERTRKNDLPQKNLSIPRPRLTGTPQVWRWGPGFV